MKKKPEDNGWNKSDSKVVEQVEETITPQNSADKIETVEDATEVQVAETVKEETPPSAEQIEAHTPSEGTENQLIDDDEETKQAKIKEIDKQIAEIDAEEEERRKKKEEREKKKQESKDKFLSSTLDMLIMFFSAVFDECYFLGAQIIRYAMDLRRRSYKLVLWGKYYALPYLKKKKRQTTITINNFAENTSYPFRDINEKTMALKRQIKRNGQATSGSNTNIIKIVYKYVISLGKPFDHIANTIAPILGFGLLAVALLYFQGINYALELQYGGEIIGYIDSERDFYKAKSLMLERLINEDYIPLEDELPSFKLVIVDEDDVMDVETLTNEIMVMSQQDVVTADGIYIDDVFLGALEDGNDFLFYISDVLDTYSITTSDDQILVKKSFIKKVTVQTGVYPQSSVKNIHEIQRALETSDSVTGIYLVQPGDTLETVAQKNNKTVEELLSYNYYLEEMVDTEVNELPTLQAGEELFIGQVELSLGVQVTMRETYVEEVDFDVVYEENPSYPSGTNAVISYGTTGKTEVVADITYINGEKVSETRLSEQVLSQPVTEYRMQGTLLPAHQLPAGSDTSASYMWPVKGGYASSYFGPRPELGDYHTGMDIAAPIGTTIRAARAGIVTYASNVNSWPWGKRVIIDHGGGMTTMYAHCSSVLVSSGQYVQQGQTIALVGNTGYSYGSHLHFQLEQWNQAINPQPYIGSYYPGY